MLSTRWFVAVLLFGTAVVLGQARETIDKVPLPDVGEDKIGKPLVIPWLGKILNEPPDVVPVISKRNSPERFTRLVGDSIGYNIDGEMWDINKLRPRTDNPNSDLFFSENPKGANALVLYTNEGRVIRAALVLRSVGDSELANALKPLRSVIKGKQFVEYRPPRWAWQQQIVWQQATISVNDVPIVVSYRRKKGNSGFADNQQSLAVSFEIDPAYWWMLYHKDDEPAGAADALKNGKPIIGMSRQACLIAMRGQAEFGLSDRKIVWVAKDPHGDKRPILTMTFDKNDKAETIVVP